jgi:hypothetical protein
MKLLVVKRFLDQRSGNTALPHPSNSAADGRDRLAGRPPVTTVAGLDDLNHQRFEFVEAFFVVGEGELLGLVAASTVRGVLVLVAVEKVAEAGTWSSWVTVSLEEAERKRKGKTADAPSMKKPLCSSLLALSSASKSVPPPAEGASRSTGWLHSLSSGPITVSYSSARRRR